LDLRLDLRFFDLDTTFSYHSNYLYLNKETNNDPNKETNNDPNVETNNDTSERRFRPVTTAFISIIFLCLVIDTTFPKVQLAKHTVILQFLTINLVIDGIDC